MDSSLESNQNLSDTYLDDIDESTTFNEEYPHNGIPNGLPHADTDTKKNPILKVKEDLNDSLISKMSNLNLDSPKPKNLSISPKTMFTLTTTTDHPLMSLSPEENFPDLIPKKTKVEDEKNSFSSIEDDKLIEGCNYGPQRNTSKNNLYFNDNFVTAESQLFNDISINAPDVAKVDVKDKRLEKITAELTSTPQRTRDLSADCNWDQSAILRDESYSHGVSSRGDVDKEEFHSGVAEWGDSPAQRARPNLDLPIEMSTQIRHQQNGGESPAALSSSPESRSSRSAFQAVLEPHAGRAALRARPRPDDTRRRILVPAEDDTCSLDSLSASSMASEEAAEPGEPDDAPAEGDAPSDDEDTRRSSNTASSASSLIPEYSAAEEFAEERSRLRVPGHASCDMRVIEPYKRVLSHGGYDKSGSAIVVFSACHLPDSARPDYSYVMDNLFLYVIWTLDRLVSAEYVVVYLHGAARRRLPAVGWLQHCYTLVARRLRKSLKRLYLVHPTFWLRTLVLLTKPFVSSKFTRKLSYVYSLAELTTLVPVDSHAIPDLVKEYDARQ